MNRASLLIFAGVVAAIVLAGGGFVAGLSVGSANASSAANATASARGAFRQGQGAPGQSGAPGAQARPVNGQVLSVGDGSITIQLGGDQGGSRIVLVAPSTRVVRTAETDIKLSEVKPGERVTVVGQESSDGTVSAQTVVIGGTNALQQLFGGSPRPSASPSR